MDNKICEKTYKEIDESIVKVELMEPEQNSENVNLNFVEVPSMNVYHSNVTAVPKRKRKRYKNARLHNLKKKHFHPKPLQPTSLILRHQFELPMMNMTTSPSNHVLNTMPIQKNIQFVTPTNVSNEMNSYIESNNSNNFNNINNSNVVGSNMNIVNSNTINDNHNSNTANIQSVTEENKIDETVEIQNSITANNDCNNDNNISSNSNINDNSTSNSDCSKYLSIIKNTSKSHKNSIELFFESMAQTVLNLPNEMQADIKMQICKIVTEAEIQYYNHYHKSQAKSMTKN